MNNILGIDPGFKGGITELDSNGTIVKMQVMPVIEVKKEKRRAFRKKEDNPDGKKTKKYISNEPHTDITALRDILLNVKPYLKCVYIEKVHSRPEEGVSSAFRFGENFGIIQGLLVALNMPFVMVTPQAWTKLIHEGISKQIQAKDRSVLAVKRLYPSVNFILPRCRKMHDGLVDATLIARYGYITGGQNV